LSHLTNHAKIVTLIPPKNRELRAFIVETAPLKLTAQALKLSHIVSKRIVYPRPSSVALKVRIPRETQLSPESFASSLYPLMTFAIPYFIEEYEPGWMGVAAFIDAASGEPSIVSAGVVVRRGTRNLRRPCILVTIVAGGNADPKAFRDYHRLVWNFLATLLSQRLGLDPATVRLNAPKPRYTVMCSLVKAERDQYIEVRIPEAHTTIKIKLPVRDPQWTFEDIPPKLREDLEVAIVKPLRARAAYAPRGLLIIGPPGVGKSVTAEAIGAALGLKLVELRPSLYRSMWYGMTEKALDRILRTLIGRRDLMILIDDADFLMGRHISIHETHVSEISILLQYLQQPHRPFIAMTTNSPDLIDPALIRPGRIDVVMFMGYPDREMRRQVVLKCLKRYRIEASEDIIDFIVRNTRWFTNAEIDALIRLAASKGGNKLSEEAVLWARTKFQINEGTRRSIQENLLWYSQRFQGIVLSYVPKEHEI